MSEDSFGLIVVDLSVSLKFLNCVLFEHDSCTLGVRLVEDIAAAQELASKLRILVTADS